MHCTGTKLNELRKYNYNHGLQEGQYDSCGTIRKVEVNNDLLETKNKFGYKALRIKSSDTKFLSSIIGCSFFLIISLIMFLIFIYFFYLFINDLYYEYNNKQYNSPRFKNIKMIHDKT